MFNKTKLMPQLEHTLPCSISTMLHRDLPPFMEKDQGLMMNNLKKRGTRPFFPHPKGPILNLQASRCHLKNAPQTNHSLPGLPMMMPAPQSSLSAKNSHINLFKITCLISKHPNAWFSDQDVSQNSLIQSGTMSWQERWSILTLFSQACT